MFFDVKQDCAELLSSLNLHFLYLHQHNEWLPKCAPRHTSLMQADSVNNVKENYINLHFTKKDAL